MEKDMELKATFDDRQIEAELKDAARKRVDDIVKRSVESWDITQIIEARVKNLISESLDKMINEALAANGKDLESRVNKGIDSLISKKIKKAIK